MKSPHVLTLYGIFIALLGSYAYMAAYCPMGYIWATYEDLIGEWTQFWLFVLTCLVSTRLVFMKTRYRKTFALLALCTFYVAMEEISWGQRLFDFPTPDLFKRHNLQSETNLHNLVTGPYSTVLKASIAYILTAGLAGFGLVYPLLLRGGWRPAKWLDAKGLAAPPLALAPFFVVAAVLETTPFSFNEAEVAEVLVGFGVACMALHYHYVTKNALSPHDSASWNGHASKSLALRFGVISVLVVTVATTTALSIYATPDGRKRIDRRVENGIDKFARRYGKYGQWETSTSLLRKLEELRPTSRATQRKLAESLRN